MNLLDFAWLAPVALAWGQLKAVALRLSGILIAREELVGAIAHRAHAELWREWKVVPMGIRQHHTLWERHRAAGGNRAPVVISMFKGAVVFRRGVSVVVWEPSGDRQGTITCMRGNFRLGRFIKRLSTEVISERLGALDARDARSRIQGPGHFVEHVIGSVGETRRRSDSGAPAGGEGRGGSLSPEASGGLTDLGGMYWSATSLYPVLNASAEDLAMADELGARPTFYLPPVMEVAVREVETYLAGRKWMEDRGIRHRRGIALVGQPGTGKSEFVRWLGARYSLPLIVAELPTFTDRDLRMVRDKARGPCILLLEDFDAVFRGRENVTGHDGPKLTFDAILNLLSGVDQVDCLSILTTNDPRSLDPALIRPGRFDRVIEVPLLDRPGRRFLADRIMAGMPAGDIDAMVDGQPDQPAADFENRCIQAAMAFFWNTHIEQPTTQPTTAHAS